MPQYSYRGKNLYEARWSGRIVATATVNDEGNYIQTLYVKPQVRRKGIASELVRFICEHRGKPLNRAPNNIKTDAVKALSAKLGDELGETVPDWKP